MGAGSVLSRQFVNKLDNLQPDVNGDPLRRKGQFSPPVDPCQQQFNKANPVNLVLVVADCQFSDNTMRAPLWEIDLTIDRDMDGHPDCPNGLTDEVMWTLKCE